MTYIFFRRMKRKYPDGTAPMHEAGMAILAVWSDAGLLVIIGLLMEYLNII